MSFVNPFRVNSRGAGDEEHRARIALLADAGDARSLTELLPFLPPDAHRLGPDAASAATSVLERCSPLQLAWFDQWYRGGWLTQTFGRFTSTAPPAPAWNDVRLGSPAWAREFKGVVALASFHRDGFVRERAVRLLTDFEDGFELPYLLIRTNDWVADVQAAALVAVSRRIARPYAPHWFRSLGLLDRLRATQRREADLARLIRRVDALLLEVEVRPLLATALSKGELSVRRATLRLALSLSPRDGQTMLLASLHDDDPVIAITAAEAVLRRAGSDDASALIDQTIGHPLARVRSLAIEAALRHEVPEGIAALRRGLFDDARSIREVVRYELSKREGALDFASTYRQALRDRQGHDRTVAFEGLAEVGTRDDLPLFFQFLHDPNARVRAAAIVGIARCDGSSHLDELTDALRDRSSVVRRAVIQYAKRYLGRGFVQRVRRELRERSERAPDHQT